MSALRPVLVTAQVEIQREIKEFLRSCLNEDQELASSFSNARMVTPSMIMEGSAATRAEQEAAAVAASAAAEARERGIFSLVRTRFISIAKYSSWLRLSQLLLWLLTQGKRPLHTRNSSSFNGLL